MEGKVLLRSNFMTISFIILIKNDKGCIFQFLESITLEQSQNSKDCDARPSEKLLAI